MNHVGDVFGCFYMAGASSYEFHLLFGPLYEEIPLVTDEENDIMRHIDNVFEIFGVEGDPSFFLHLLLVHLLKIN